MRYRESIKIRAPRTPLSDTVIASTPRERKLLSTSTTVSTSAGGRSAKFYAIDRGARLGGEHFALSPRFDWYKDRDGFITPFAQTMKEFTNCGLEMGGRVPEPFRVSPRWSDQPSTIADNGIAMPGR
jgi:hypothetical protein